MGESAASLPAAGHWRDAYLALRNALKIGGSLLATWSVALAVRFLLPRLLGPEQYGVYNFTEAFAMSFFVLAGLGLETYVQKEIPVRPAHASEFFGGVLAARLLLAAGLIAAMAAVLHATARPPEVRSLVYLFAAGQFLFVGNATFAALLHARGTVDGLSVSNVLTKLLWGAGILLALRGGFGLTGLAAAFTLSEAVKAVSLFVLCRRHLDLRLRVDARAARR